MKHYQTFELDEEDGGWWAATQTGSDITGRGSSAAEAIRNYCDVVLGDEMERQDVEQCGGRDE